MASTSTNKQPLFIDRVLHYVIDLDSAYNTGIIIGQNTAEVLVDATSSDGAILEDIYLIAKSTVASNVNLFLSTSRDFLRQTEANFVGSFASPTTVGESISWTKMPKSLAPVPHVGDNPYNQAFYVPKGTVLWVARDGNAVLNDNSGPIIGCQGGWY